MEGEEEVGREDSKRERSLVRGKDRRGRRWE